MLSSRPRTKQDPPGATCEETVQFIPVAFYDNDDDDYDVCTYQVKSDDEFGREYSIDDYNSGAMIYSSKQARKHMTCWMIAATTFTISLLIITLSVKLLNETNRSASTVGLAPINESSHFFDTLLELSFHEGTEFDSETSYQYKALMWVQQSGSNSHEELGDMGRMLQRYALACIHFATKKDPSNTYIPSGVGWLTPSTDECQWLGVTCNNNGQVKALDLSMNALNGTFPKEAAYLNQTLVELHLSGTSLTNSGAEGHAFLTYLRGLEILDVSDTRFVNDGMPLEYSRLTSMQILKAGRVHYAGLLDASIFQNLRELEELDLSEISFAPSLFPLSLTFLPRLHTLTLVNNRLRGDIGILLRQPWPSLKSLQIEGTDMVGSLPSDLLTQNLDSLQQLSVANGSIEGTIPSALGLFTNLQQLALFNNSLTGTIPSSLGALSALSTLALEGNNLSGWMPDEVCLNRYGGLEILKADCVNKVECPCCTCCGRDCSKV